MKTRAAESLEFGTPCAARCFQEPFSWPLAVIAIGIRAGRGERCITALAFSLYLSAELAGGLRYEV